MTSNHDETRNNHGELAEAIARQHYSGLDAPCPWEAIDPIAQAIIIHAASEWLDDAIPALKAAGWREPHPGIDVTGGTPVRATFEEGQQIGRQHIIGGLRADYTISDEAARFHDEVLRLYYGDESADREKILGEVRCGKRTINSARRALGLPPAGEHPGCCDGNHTDDTTEGQA